MRRSEDCNLTAGDGRRFRPVRTESARREEPVSGPGPLSGKAETAGPVFRSPVPRSGGRAQWSLRFRAAGRGRPVTVSREESAAERSWAGAKTVIPGRRGRRFRRDASASRRNRPGRHRPQPWLPGEAETADPFPSPSVDSKGWREGRQRHEARRIASRQRSCRSEEASAYEASDPVRAGSRGRPGSQPNEAKRGV